MTKIFFSHASEDKAIVEAVYHEFVTAYPRHSPWVDKYEIVGGDSLITKIAEGMDDADKFFIFLSPTAVQKPWVQRELRRALMKEISGVNPNYIVPVRIGDLKELPPFLEERLYIDMASLCKAEWLAQFDAAIRGEQRKPVAGTSKVRVTGEYGDRKNIARVTFTARAWAEEFSWAVETTEDMREAYLAVAGAFSMIRTIKQPRIFARRFESPELRPGRPFTVHIQFDEGVDALASIPRVTPWRPEPEELKFDDTLPRMV